METLHIEEIITLTEEEKEYWYLTLSRAEEQINRIHGV